MTQVTIAGVQLEIKAPYAEGHALNAAEASVLNQTFLENVRNNAAGKIKAAKAKAEAAGATFSVDAPIGGEGEDAAKTLRQVIEDYANTYQFGVRTVRASEPVDPVEREARAIAKDVVAKALREKGIKRKDVTDEAYEATVAKVAAGEKVQAAAKRRVKERESIGADELDLGLGGDEPAAA